MRHRVRNYLQSHWRPILNVITIVAMVSLVYALRNQIMQTLRDVQTVQWWALLLMVPLQFLNYDSYTRMYAALLQHLKQPVSYRNLYRITLELTFVNHAFPSGGISGISYFGLRLRNFGVKTSAATLIQLIKFVLIFLSFQVLVGFGLLALAVGGKANNIMLLFAGVLATLTVVATVLMAYVIGDKQRIGSTFSTLTRWLNRIIHIARPKHPETVNVAKLQHFAYDLHNDFQELKADRKLFKKVLFLALAANITELLTLYVVYIAFGELVNIGAVIIAYAIANFAGLVSVLPGGVGIYEVLMTATLTAGGIPAALSIPVVVMYRILSMSIQLIPGAILYQKSLAEGQTK